MIRVDVIHNFQCPVSDAFAYITDKKHWPQYWPDFVQIQDVANARWGRAGDELTIVLKLLNRERALNMKLEQFRKDALVAYVSRQRGLPDVQHERHFREVPGGCEFGLVVAYETRRGMSGLFDRFLLKWAITRALRKTMVGSHRAAPSRNSTHGAKSGGRSNAGAGLDHRHFERSRGDRECTIR